MSGALEGSHTLALKSDGTVWAWGWNAYGQLGDGTATDSFTPVQVSALTGVTQIAGGYLHSLALKSDGTVWVWGFNNSGQLGDGTTVDSAVPVQVSGLTGVTQVSAGSFHSLAVKTDGTVFAWGNNNYGQLGDGTNTNRLTPVQVTGLTGVTQVSGGGYHSLALKSDGTVWAWGRNDFGKLGDGTNTDKNAPVQVTGLTGVTQVAGGYLHSLALKSDGTVFAWGYNNSGQLGDGTTTTRLTPVQVSGLTGIAQVAAGSFHSLALIPPPSTSTTKVKAWGSNPYYNLGDGTNTDRNSAVTLSNITNVAQVVVGAFHTLVVKTDGTVWAWGANFNGQLGDGTTADSAVPVQVTGLLGVARVATAYYHSLAVKTDGTVWAWGLNTFGQVGDGTTTDSLLPVQVSGLTGVTQVVASNNHSLALKSDGTVWAWGYNGDGELGDGTTTDRAAPVQVSGLTGVTQIAASGLHSLALKTDGTVMAWGYNGVGELGDGTNDDAYAPVPVINLTGVAQVSAGSFHSLAVKTDGTVFAWGYNNNGQLGDGTSVAENAPIQVSGLTGITQVGGGFAHSLALKSDGTVWAWGSNTAGQLGDGTYTDKNAPVQVKDAGDASGFLQGVTQITTKVNHSLVLASNSTASLAVDSITVAQGDAITFTATLHIASPAGKRITFFVDGATKSRDAGTTDANGFVSVSSHRLAPGVHSVIAKFAGDSGSPAVSGSATITVLASTTLTLTVAPDWTGLTNYPVSGNLSVKTTGVGIAGQTIAISMDGTAIGSAITDANGDYQLDGVISPDLAPGRHKVTAVFAGSSLYVGDNSPVRGFRLSKWAAPISDANASRPVGSDVGFNVTVTPENALHQDTLVGMNIRFINLTDSNGVVVDAGLGTAALDSDLSASLTYTIPELLPGVYTLTTKHGANAYYAAYEGIGTLTVSKAGTTLAPTSLSGKAGKTVTLKATLTRNIHRRVSKPLANRTVTFKLDGVVIGTGATGGAGVASFSYVIPARASKGAHAITAVFDGDAYDNGSTGSGTLTVQ
ncbi:MAG: Ig-like domain repeat protein [Armatimonadetes bacterium]|nr:Ig-like domain repeat protein [Armatimonadota bacterium]